jgi:RNA polymerase-binding transcription factor DksA
MNAGTDSREPRQALAAERAGAQERLTGLERDFAGIVESSVAANADDEHDPEGATIAFERQHLVALIEQARDHLAGIDAALRRVADGTYGRCAICGQPIAPERLAARPTATRCVGCASRR